MPQIIRNSSLKFIILSLSLLSATAVSNSFRYDDIAKRHLGGALTVEQVDQAKMHGECLVGLKELNFKKKDDFDPVAEWTNYRTISLLEQFPPCQVLVMMEVAQGVLKNGK